MNTSISPEEAVTRGRGAVFLDRDGVLVEDVHLLRERGSARLIPGVPEALMRLRDAGLALIVATNQAVVSRGEATMAEVAGVNAQIADQIRRSGGPEIDGWYVCPHHPHADISKFRVECDCRKPRPGLLLRAARDIHLELRRSFMVGDRVTDVVAGAAAGCATVLVRTGAHDEPPIVVVDPLPDVEPDHACDTLVQAADWILARVR
jgi:D-glycero-D-manno-heptose 1,7-bisphosphate phosphatase